MAKEALSEVLFGILTTPAANNHTFFFLSVHLILWETSYSSFAAVSFQLFFCFCPFKLLDLIAMWLPLSVLFSTHKDFQKGLKRVGSPHPLNLRWWWVPKMTLLSHLRAGQAVSQSQKACYTCTEACDPVGYAATREVSPPVPEEISTPKEGLSKPPLKDELSSF